MSELQTIAKGPPPDPYMHRQPPRCEANSTGEGSAVVRTASPSNPDRTRRAETKARILTGVLLLLTTMSAFGQSVYEKKDKFAGSTLFFTKLRDANLEGDSLFTERYVMFSFEATSPVSALVRNPFYLHVDTRTNDWILIRAGESLQLKIDGGEIVGLKGMGSIESRNVVSGDIVLESANWEIPLALIQRIASAKTVEFRILGDRQTTTGSFKANFMADARGFAAKAPGLLLITAPKPE